MNIPDTRLAPEVREPVEQIASNLYKQFHDSKVYLWATREELLEVVHEYFDDIEVSELYKKGSRERGFAPSKEDFKAVSALRSEQIARREARRQS